MTIVYIPCIGNIKYGKWARTIFTESMFSYCSRLEMHSPQNHMKIVELFAMHLLCGSSQSFMHSGEELDCI